VFMCRRVVGGSEQILKSFLIAESHVGAVSSLGSCPPTINPAPNPFGTYPSPYPLPVRGEGTSRPFAAILSLKNLLNVHSAFARSTNPSGDDVSFADAFTSCSLSPHGERVG